MFKKFEIFMVIKIHIMIFRVMVLYFLIGATSISEEHYNHSIFRISDKWVPTFQRDATS
jgi:hypothetical protein